MIYTSCNSNSIKKYFKTNIPQIISFDNIGCDEIEDKVSGLLMDNDYIIYNNVALDYIEPKNIIFIDNCGTPHNFESFFKDKLEYMYPGEVLLNLHIKLGKETTRL